LVCQDEKSVVTVCSDLTHTFCPECIQGYIVANLGDQQQYPMKCLANQVGCDQLNLQGIVRAVLSDEQFEIVERRTLESALGPGLVARCDACGYLNYAGHARPNGSGRCTRCRIVFCRNCGICEPCHLSMTCEAYRARNTPPDPQTLPDAVLQGRVARMCGQCRCGPVVNYACSNLATHNNDRPFTNHCSNCGWFDRNWGNWPEWDGIYGPH